MRMMTAKDLHIAVKREDGVQYLMKKFAIDTEEALFEVIKKVTPDHYEGFVKDLSKAARRVTKRNSAVPDSKPEEVVVKTVTVEEQEPVEIFKGESATKKEDKAMQLSELLEEEQQLSTSLCLVEGLHKELVSKRRNLVAQLENEKRAITNLVAEVNKRREIVMTLYTEYNECANEMQKLNGDMRAYEELIADVRKEIEVARRVVICIYDTGTIEIANAEMPVLSQEDVNAQFEMLITMPEAEELTVKCLKSIAQLRVMAVNFPEAEVIFESDAVKALYEA